MIDNFGVSNLFGRENYEYYARITGRILKVEEDWIYNFRYPPDCFVSRKFFQFKLVLSVKRRGMEQTPYIDLV